MDIGIYKSKVKEGVVAEMLAYKKEVPECGYRRGHVAKCRRLLFGYLNALDKISSPTDEKIMEQVKNLVLALNKLNEKTDYSLIETDARECIWEIIQSSAVECGLREASEDITEEWREW